jgi:hypothetical protein
MVEETINTLVDNQAMCLSSDLRPALKASGESVGDIKALLLIRSTPNDPMGRVLAWRARTF